MAKVTNGHDVVPVEGTHPFFVLYTSGTTGSPKGIYRSHGGSLVAFNYMMKTIFNVNQGNVMLAASDVGWIVGHNFIVYGPFVRGGTSVMYEGKPVGTPDPGQLWKMIETYKVNSFYIAPTSVRAIKKEDIEGNFIRKYDTSTLTGIHLGKLFLNLILINYSWRKM